MGYFMRVSVTIALVSMIIGFAFLWDYLANKLPTKSNQMKIGKGFVVFITMLIQFTIVSVISIAYGFFFVDTLFITCFVILCVTWLYSYFGTYSHNNRNVTDKYHGGAEAEVKVFKLKMNPVLIGIYSFSILGILVSLIYYAPYFFE
ncbi:hypothetical protein WMZ97_08195 [Lentibacillus sp. N15]|uniref:hypothetical protein n=1 Tax=Lentibacillus songyuanensis TaxID=3136161 RepID=UPI0031BB8FB0